MSGATTGPMAVHVNEGRREYFLVRQQEATAITTQCPLDRPGRPRFERLDATARDMHDGAFQPPARQQDRAQ